MERDLSISISCVTSNVDQKLQALSSEPFERCIFKIPNQLRTIQPSCYDPQIIAIGPYHHGKDHLNAMEELKTRYLQMLLHRRNEDSSRRYIEAIMKIVDDARRYYDESVNGISKEKFVEIMVLDGCFIIEVIRKNKKDEQRDQDSNAMVLYRIKHDLLLLENQIPYFILQVLFDMTAMPNEKCDFLALIGKFFNVLPGPGYKGEQDISQGIKHLLELVHDNWLPSQKGLTTYHTMKELKDTRDIRCATELYEAGIKFSKLKNCGTLFDIKYEKGVLYIPPLSIDDRTESLFRNLIAYEQLSNKKGPDHVTDYVIFLDSLINTAKDVKLLCQCGIINNWLGNDEIVATTFNRLCDNVVPYKKYYYSEVCEKVQGHCRKRLNLWMAKLRHDYFNSPWALISFIAAFMLIVFAFLQTLYTIIDFYSH